MPLSKDGDTPSAVRNPISAWSTQKRTAAHARRRFKRKNGGFWRAQFCTEVAHPTRFERVTFAFGGQGWGYSRGLPEFPWNYSVPVVG
jgi:hypothetical protein